jgi:hypothetical protein
LQRDLALVRGGDRRRHFCGRLGRGRHQRVPRRPQASRTNASTPPAN